MSLFRLFRKSQPEHPDVEKMKKELTEAAQNASEQATSLNHTLNENGITLQIKIAAGGKH